jgi:type I restriction enzyme M protein
MIKSLKSTGKAAVILPHGVLFRGNSEAIIRKVVIRRGYIKGIIGLPANLFYGTGIPACIIVLDKDNARARTGIFMIDASKGFAKDGNKNRLRPRDMHQIIDTFVNQKETPRYSRMVPVAEIADARNDYNLNIPRYIDSSEPEDIQDLHAHLKGGIPNRDLDALQPYWDAFPSLRQQLFKPLRDGYSELAVDKNEVRAAITGSPEYEAFATTGAGALKHWWNKHAELLLGIGRSSRPKDIIAELGDSLLEGFRPRPLIDEYGVYEQLMSYWNSVMHDDVAMIMSDGWDDAARPRPTIDNKERKLNETPDIVVGTGRGATKWKMDLIPPNLIVDRYFAEEKSKVDNLVASAETASQTVEEFIEENSGDDGPLADAMDNEKISKALASARLKVAKREDPHREEVTALAALIGLYDAEAAAKRVAKDAQARLDEATLKRYTALPTGDIQSLVVDDKWGGHMVAGIRAEIDVLIRQLVARLGVLGERYEKAVGDIEADAERLSVKVATHLAAMGFEA